MDWWLRTNPTVQIFSLKRAVVSLILGFLLPLSYAFLLSETFDYLRRPAPEFLAWPFAWPRPLWIFLMGRQPSESDLIGGIVFIASCNILLYGSMTYVALLILSRLRGKPMEIGEPPPPKPFAASN
jgi:hypothetical protein